MDTDEFRTIENVATGNFSDRRSKFLAFACPTQSTEEAMSIVKKYRNQFCDAKHVCWAYNIGTENVNRANDDGEPSSTAGKPILGQIHSYQLTNVVIVVVRYFGGVELGTSGLINAYKTAAKNAIENATIVSVTVSEIVKCDFPYEKINDVMRVVKKMQGKVVQQNFHEQNCLVEIAIRKKDADALHEQLKHILIGTGR